MKKVWGFIKGFFSMVFAYPLTASIYYKHIARMQGWDIPYERLLDNLHLVLLIVLWGLAGLLLIVTLVLPFATVKNEEDLKKRRRSLNSMAINTWYKWLRTAVAWVITIGYGIVGAWGFLAVGLVLRALTWIASEFAKNLLKDLGDEYEEVKE